MDSVNGNCKEYLVKVQKLSTACTTFDTLRALEFENNDSVFDLPPTSFSCREAHPKIAPSSKGAVKFSKPKLRSPGPL